MLANPRYDVISQIVIVATKKWSYAILAKKFRFERLIDPLLAMNSSSYLHRLAFYG